MVNQSLALGKSKSGTDFLINQKFKQKQNFATNDPMINEAESSFFTFCNVNMTESYQVNQSLAPIFFTLGFAIHTLPKGSTLATSTVGVKNNEEAEKIWRDGMCEVLEVAKPKTLILYGGGFDDFDFGNVNVIKLKTNTAFKKGEHNES